MKKLNTYAWVLVLCVFPIFAVACGGNVEILGQTDPDNAAGSAGTSDEDGGSFAGEAGSAGSSDSDAGGDAQGTGGTSADGGSAGSSGSSGSSGAAGEAGAPSEDGGSDAIVEQDGGTDGGGDEPDADPGQDSGTDSGADSDAGCEPRLVATWNSHYDTTVCPGDVAIQTLTFTLTAECQDMDVERIMLRLSTPDFANTDSTPYCEAPCASPDDWYFRNFKLTTSTGATVMGPIDAPSQHTSNDWAHLTFTDSFSLKAGESKLLILQMNVSATFTSSLAETRYRALLLGVDYGSGDIPYVVENNVDPNDTVKVKQSCPKPDLSISLSPYPIGTIHVKKQQDVPAVGLTFKAGMKDVTIDQITLTGQADRGTPSCGFGTACAQSEFAKDLTVMCLYNESIQVGLCQAPDLVTGKATFNNLSMSLGANASVTLTVKAGFSSTIGNPAGDKIAIGIVDTYDVVAWDAALNAVTAYAEPEVHLQLAGAPSIVQTILNSGRISIAADSHPASTIVRAGQNEWTLFARYKATAEYEAATIDRIAVTTSGSTANGSDFTELAIAKSGVVMGSEVSPSSPAVVKDIDLSSNPIIIPKDSSVVFEIWGKLAPVVAWSLNSATSGVARSGDRAFLFIMGSVTGGEWDANYLNKMNVRTTGDVSGERLYTSGSGQVISNPMVLRKSKPTVTKLAVASNVLMNADMDLYKFQVTPDAAGPIEIAQFGVRCQKSAGLTLGNFGVRKGSTEMQWGTEATPHADTTNTLIWVPVTNQVVSGSGTVFTVHATVTGVVTGSSLVCSFDRTPASQPVTGILRNDGPNPRFVLSSGDGNPYVPVESGYEGTFLWSDLSEIPHSKTSFDWTNDLYVQDLTQTQVLAN